MAAWLHSHGKRCCSVVSFVSPGRYWLGGELQGVPSVIALRLGQALTDLTDLTLEFDDGARWALAACALRETNEPGAWDLICELESL